MLLCVTSAALATGWIIERQSYERRLSTRLEKQLFDVRDVEAEISAAIKNNSFAWHSILLDDGIESKDRFDELRRNRLQENVINLHEMQAVLDNNQFDFDNAEEFVSDRKSELRRLAGESLSLLQIDETEQLSETLADLTDVFELQDIQLSLIHI